MNEGGAGPFERPIESDESVSEAVVMAVSAATGRPPTPGTAGTLDELDGLYGTVDSDALDVLFRGRPDVRLAFEWAGCRVEIVDGARVVVTRLD